MFASQSRSRRDFVTASRSSAQPSFGAACEAFSKGLVRRVAAKAKENANGKPGTGRIDFLLDGDFGDTL